MDDLTADDCRLLLSLLNHAIVAPDQRERVERCLQAKRAELKRAPRDVGVRTFVRLFTVTVP